eukprot:438992-Alexandrium_andersonii.AAC.1
MERGRALPKPPRGRKRSTLPQERGLARRPAELAEEAPEQVQHAVAVEGLDRDVASLALRK